MDVWNMEHVMKFMFWMSNQQIRGHDNFTNCHDSVHSNGSRSTPVECPFSISYPEI